MQQIIKTTPLMQQYFKTKENFSDSLIFFQVGDFYELFFDDAKKAAQYLGIALTKRGTHNGQPVPLCGVPMHASSFYISKLVKGGFKVAVCDQLEEAQPGKKLVERGITQVYTPGTLTDSTLLDEKAPSYLAAVFPEKEKIQVVFGELLTGQLYGTVIENDMLALESELVRFKPGEVLVSNDKVAHKITNSIKKLGFYVSPILGDFDQNFENPAFDAWSSSLGVASLQSMAQAAQLFYTYLFDHHKSALYECKKFYPYSAQDFLILDAVTQNNLEIFSNSVDNSSKHTLFEVLDHAMTSMGSRTIKKWLARPLLNKKKIEARLEVVEGLVAQQTLLNEIREHLKAVGDLERVVGRMALGRASLNDYGALEFALQVVPSVVKILAECSVPLLQGLASRFANFSSLSQLLFAAINTDTSQDKRIKDGFDVELDRLRELVNSGTSSIAALEKKEQEATGISSLKIRYTSVHGYYIEVTKTNYHLVPERYQRTQTLAGRERYSTTDLKELEHEINRAHREIAALEKEVFERVKCEVLEFLVSLQKASQALSYIDALCSLACVAYENNYVRPEFNDARDIIINEGRHPVVEKIGSESYIPNDIMLTKERAFWIITGPNMGGKSTFLRQAALTSIMAQIGSFVPAKAASLPILDRIFTRIGASDKVSQGKSTFLVEMEETALICKQATQNSLVILDEVGRGTSTYDGLAIAQSVVEYLHTEIGARGLFATHYHELTELEKDHPGISSYYAASRRHDNRLVFLYKILPGNADGSFGIDVAELAELPENVIKRARHIHSKLSL